MFSYIRETDDSTTVNFSTYGKFIPSSGSQLITIGAKFLRIFRTNPYALIPPKKANEDWQQKTRLECVFSTRLLNAPKDFAITQLPSHPNQDALLLTFDDAKLSMVVFNELERNLETVSLHSFEDEYLRDGFTRNCKTPIVRTDPSHRCAAMLVYGSRIVIIPFIDGQPRLRSFNIPLKKIDPSLDNVCDMVFLDGYHEPTLLFLYEPLQTTAGRAAIRYDTCCIMGVSVNSLDEQFAVVWQLANLPCDCNKILAVPKPIGGAVVFGSNELIYLNQAVPPCGIALNSCHDGFTKFPLRDMKHLSLTLDCAAVEWAGEGRIFVGTMDGRLCVASLEADSASSVKSIDFRPLCDVSIPHCLSTCAPGHLFLGSRLGDSQLFKYAISTIVIEDDDETEEFMENGSEPEAKRAKRGEIELDEDDIALYGETVNELKTGPKTRTEQHIEMIELDRLLNVGPVKTMTATGAHGTSIELLERANTGQMIDPIFDIIAASGHHKDGALCVMQRTLRPEIITSSQLHGAQQMWAVGRSEDDSHRYLIVSKARSTLVLELGEEMVELEEPLFVTSEPTIAAGELADGGLAVQITSMCVALVADRQQLQEVQLDSNFPVVAASIVDPFVALLTQDGRLLLFQLASHPHVHLKSLDISQSPFADHRHNILTAISIYKDMSGLMVCSTGKEEFVFESEHKNNLDKTIDDEMDALYSTDDDFKLYGESSSSKKAKKKVEDFSRKKKRHGNVIAATGGEESDAPDPNTVDPTYWLVAARENGRLVIYSLPDMTLVYQVRKFNAMPELLMDMNVEEEERERKEHIEKASRAVATDNADIEDHKEINRPEERIVETHIIGMGINQGRPVLMSIIDDLLIAYEMYSRPNRQSEHLCISFRRLPHTVCLRSSPFMSSEGTRNEVAIGKETERQRQLVVPFERISTVVNGVLLIGAEPHLFVLGAWGGLTKHALTLDGPIRAFTPFNNQNILNGMLYLIDKGSGQELRIANLETSFDYELPYPTMKVPVGETVQSVRYLMGSQVLAVVSSAIQPCNKMWVVVNDDKQLEVHEKSEEFVLPTVQNYSLCLYSPENWAPVPNTAMEFGEMEVVTACEEVALRSESTLSGLQSLLAIGTINNFGEEVSVRGRIMLAEIIEVVPEPGQPTSKHRIKKIYDKEQKGPVTALCAMDGYLLSGMGQKIFIWSFKDNELQGLSFLDMHYYIHQIVPLRNIALACDIQESLSLIRFQEDFKALSIVSRDERLGIQAPMASQFLVDGGHLGFLLSDECGNIHVFNYAPETKETCGGERLLLRAVINIGTNVNAWLRVKGHTSHLDLVAKEMSALSQQMTAIFGSLDGSFGYVRPISEKSFRRLHFLQQFMGTAVPQVAGLNPKGSRSARPPRPTINAQNPRHLVDGDVVERFLHLSTTDKQELARRLGANRYNIIDDIFQVKRMAAYF